MIGPCGTAMRTIAATIVASATPRAIRLQHRRCTANLRNRPDTAVLAHRVVEAG
jgi:hypothetical protein